MIAIIFPYLKIVLSSASVYIFIVFAIRLFGKNELAQLSVIDLVFILLISNAVQNAMVGTNSTLGGGIVAATSLFAVDYLFKNIMYRFPRFNKLIQGEPLLLIYNGKINKKNIIKAKIPMDEIMEVIREHGVSKIEQVDLAVLEVDGNISVMSGGAGHMTTKRKKAHKTITKNT
ncbi:DUF421 domain-containing protein [Clostridium estertheticum]|uniref:DUF421 domain-containing protein n=1 Tax=Clostridium estertheticum TaxID=238834 RepID=A0AA47EG03_9CLOT|nr:YetF domain-containing protein [Clostridium estertheticum]MBU3156808.1 DUF421 domain-containing protein [Clostridium estertheticum]MBU3200039.1 DUF421 domain-containing protein [Clostridium estertheticum]WAG59502.1 DUF421 domain-containing protein [Clostridium estertheticum]WAG66421.1 DUF421 domain-containing protein [Clostridium estertheticum]